MRENREFTVKFEKNAVRDFEKIMLTSGQCSIFIPMGFINADSTEYGSYDCRGFVPLSNYCIDRTEDALYILENVLIILKKSVEYFIDPAKITVNADTVFYNCDTEEIKIAYIPLNSEDMNMRRNLVRFISELSGDISDGREGYLAEAAEYISYHNYYHLEVINEIGRLRRDIYSETGLDS